MDGSTRGHKPEWLFFIKSIAVRAVGTFLGRTGEYEVEKHEMLDGAEHAVKKLLAFLADPSNWN